MEDGGDDIVVDVEDEGDEGIVHEGINVAEEDDEGIVHEGINMVMKVRKEDCSLDVVVLASDEVVGVLGSFRLLDENFVKLWKSLPKGKMGIDERMWLEIAEFQR
ncbi:unnamed protein product [Prunus armeniaca]